MKQALIVGINDYALEPLRGCKNDAAQMAKVLQKNGDGSPNFNVVCPANVYTRGELRGLLNTLFSADADMALFYFSGHGCLNDFGGYIVTPDMAPNDIGIPMEEVLTMANMSDIRNKIIILDCCNSGAFGAPAGTVSTTNLKRGVTVLTASREKESALDGGFNSVFTALLLEALRGSAADLKGDITPGSIYAFIDQAIGNWGQRPMFKANIARFTNLRTVVPAIKVEILRRLTALFHLPDASFALDPSFEYTNTEVAVAENVAVFKELQKLAGVGLVIPVGEEHMYWAAQNSKSCVLTAVGRHYWRLVKEGLI